MNHLKLREMNKLDKDYCDLLQDILDNGTKKMDRTGTGTISVFGRQIRHKMSDGFPLLTTKKMFFKGIVTELLWFLRGDTNIKYLLDNNCHIWDGDCYKAYEKEWMKENPPFSGPYTDKILSKEDFINKIKTDDDFANKWGDLGPVYGKQWRKWRDNNGVVGPIDENPRIITWNNIDQIQNLINDLKNNPDSRRLMVNAWNVADIPNMTLPPCHFGFQVYTRELTLKERFDYGIDILGYNSLLDYGLMDGPEFPNIVIDSVNELNIPKRTISLKWNQRSVDTFLGLPFNIASYGLLLEILAKEVNMVPDELIGDLGDTHLYLNHIDAAKEQIGKKMTTEERNEWFIKNWCGGNKKDCKGDWKDFELDQQCVPKRTREPYRLPKLDIKLHFNNEPSFTPEYWLVDDFQLLNYESHSTIKAELSN